MGRQHSDVYSVINMRLICVLFLSESFLSGIGCPLPDRGFGGNGDRTFQPRRMGHGYRACYYYSCVTVYKQLFIHNKS